MGIIKGSTQSVITVIFSTLFLLVVIVMIIYVVVPQLQYGFIDACWGDFSADTGRLVTGIYQYGYRNQTINFGECSSAMYFVNKKTMRDTVIPLVEAFDTQMQAERPDVSLADTLLANCDENAEAYILATPWFGKSADLGGPWRWVFIAGAIGALAGHNTKLTKITIPIKGKKIPILTILTAAYGGYQGYELYEDAVEFINSMEQRTKTTKCYSLDKPFEDELTIVPPIDQNHPELVSGDWCVILYKDRDFYKIGFFNEKGRCQDDPSQVKDIIDGFRENNNNNR